MSIQQRQLLHPQSIRSQVNRPVWLDTGAPPHIDNPPPLVRAFADALEYFGVESTPAVTSAGGLISLPYQSAASFLHRGSVEIRQTLDDLCRSARAYIYAPTVSEWYFIEGLLRDNLLAGVHHLVLLVPNEASVEPVLWTRVFAAEVELPGSIWRSRVFVMLELEEPTSPSFSSSDPMDESVENTNLPHWGGSQPDQNGW